LDAADRALRAAGYPYAVVGGLAVSVRTEPRFTRDVDFVVAVASDDQAERLVLSLSTPGFRVRASVEHGDHSRLSTIRLLAPGENDGGVVVDLLFASSGIEAEVAHAAERLEVLPGLVLPVATTGHLIALKALSRNDRTRPQDAADLRALIRVAEESELHRAREAVRLIVERGFHRNRPVAEDLEVALKEARSED
jgi:predicted nucleotidyltransferase